MFRLKIKKTYSYLKDCKLLKVLKTQYTRPTRMCQLLTALIGMILKEAEREHGFYEHLTIALNYAPMYMQEYQFVKCVYLTILLYVILMRAL